MLCDSDTASSWKPCYVKFGHRGRALLSILLWYYDRSLLPPQWLLNLGRIPAIHKGVMTSALRRASALSLSASAEIGIIKHNWVEHVMCVQAEGAAFGDTVRDQLALLSPGYASRIADWQLMES